MSGRWLRLCAEADLPAAPDPLQNGWSEVVAPSRANVSIPPEIVALLRSDNPNETRPLLERARAQEVLLGETLNTKPSRDALAAFERALTKPRFADACPVKLEQPCRVFPLLGAHRTVLLLPSPPCCICRRASTPDRRRRDRPECRRHS